MIKLMVSDAFFELIPSFVFEILLVTDHVFSAVKASALHHIL